MAPFPSATKIFHDNTYDSISPTRPELSAKGKAIVITGGGSGIGAETARHFAQAGASRIALLGRREQPLIDTKASINKNYPNVDVFIASTDISNKGDVDSAFEKFAGDGKLHILVSNAAMTGPHDTVPDADSELFLSAIQTNIQGSLYVAQAFLRYAAEDAVVIDVSSNVAHLNYDKFASYGVAKTAVVRLWDFVAAARPGMSIFHIQPGVVDTAMNREADGIRMIGHEDHVSLPASFNVWLASPEAKFLKGKFLWTNWDVDELKARAKEIESSTQFNFGMVGWPF